MQTGKDGSGRFIERRMGVSLYLRTLLNRIIVSMEVISLPSRHLECEVWAGHCRLQGKILFEVNEHVAMSLWLMGSENTFKFHTCIQIIYAIKHTITIFFRQWTHIASKYPMLWAIQRWTNEVCLYFSLVPASDWNDLSIWWVFWLFISPGLS